MNQTKLIEAWLDGKVPEQGLVSGRLMAVKHRLLWRCVSKPAQRGRTLAFFDNGIVCCMPGNTPYRLARYEDSLVERISKGALGRGLRCFSASPLRGALLPGPRVPDRAAFLYRWFTDTPRPDRLCLDLTLGKLLEGGRARRDYETLSNNDWEQHLDLCTLCGVEPLFPTVGEHMDWYAGVCQLMDPGPVSPAKSTI